MEQPVGNPPRKIRIYNDPEEDLEDDLRPEYDFSSLKARPNPYAARARERLRVKEQARQKAEEDYSSKMQRELGINPAPDQEQLPQTPGLKSGSSEKRLSAFADIRQVHPVAPILMSTQVDIALQKTWSSDRGG